jgi:hypothetical protein
MGAGKQGVAERGAWRPDARASFGLAVMAALLVMIGFAALFASAASIKILQPTASIAERLLFAAPPLPPPSRPMSRKHVPVPSMLAPLPMQDGAWPPLQPPVSLPDAFTAQDYLKERAQQGAATLRDKVTGNELRRELGKPADMPALRDNQSLPVAGGDKVVRHGDSCAQIHTVQGSPSPTNKVDVAEPGACPGGPHDASQDMSKALHDWAEKHHPPLE